MNRTDRLFAILLEIQSHPSVTSTSLAQRFDVSKRTIYRDVAALIEANVPVTGKAGGGYSIDEGYFLPPVSFTHDEALMLMLGVDIVGQYFDSKYSKASRNAQNKINATLPKELKREIRYLKSFLKFYASSSDGSGRDHALQAVRNAILEKKRIVFRYYKRHAHTTEPVVREVDPYALTNINGYWLLSDYDHLRNDIRAFRLDRMETPMVTKKSYERPKNFTFTDLAKESGGQSFTCIIKLSRLIERWACERPPFRIIKRNRRGGYVQLTVSASNEQDVVSWILRWGADAEAVGPDRFRAAVKQAVQQLAEKYF